jgi:hypothetical protein
MADAKAIEDCKREISLLQVLFSLIIKFYTECLILAIKSSKCN